MPALDASALDTDPDGLAFLRAVLDQGRTLRPQELRSQGSREPRTPEAKPRRPRAAAKLALKSGPALREIKPRPVPPRSKSAPRPLDARR